MGVLTTHVLDLNAGIPAAGVCVHVHRLGPDGYEPLARDVTGANGRCAKPLLDGAHFSTGFYMITFAVADYFRMRDVPRTDPPFLEEAVLRFGVAGSDPHYHLPLLISPWSFSIYRGS